MRGKLHAMHGRDHGPHNLDPSYTEDWHVVGDPGEPEFQNGWANYGAGYGPTRFKLVVGPAAQPKQTVEIVLAVDGGGTGTTIFTLPPGYFEWADGESVPGSAHDSAGTYRAYHIDGATGDVVDGV